MSASASGPIGWLQPSFMPSSIQRASCGFGAPRSQAVSPATNFLCQKSAFGPAIARYFFA